MATPHLTASRARSRRPAACLCADEALQAAPEGVVPLRVLGHVHQHRRQPNQRAVAQHQPHLREEAWRCGCVASGSIGRQHRQAASAGSKRQAAASRTAASGIPHPAPTGRAMVASHLPRRALQLRLPLVHLLVRQARVHMRRRRASHGTGGGTGGGGRRGDRIAGRQRPVGRPWREFRHCHARRPIRESPGKRSRGG